MSGSGTPSSMKTPSSPDDEDYTITVVKRERKGPPLFNDLPFKTTEACKTFTVLKECVFLGRTLGRSGQVEAMTCDCKEDWDGRRNAACGDESDCINRLTSIECTNDKCTCGNDCQNQRFQKRQYAKVDVIQTNKKGYGLRALDNIPQGTFIYEYIGEVVDEPMFLQRMKKYEQNGIRHFYFMMLQKGEFIDATTKGCLARFCNHSCRPNSYVDKWVVGDKLRMGIFSKRDIIKGEEITFDYNVDRYGTQAQPCFCGESNCVGFLGGKTQTEVILPPLIVESLDLSLQDTRAWRSTHKKNVKKSKEELSQDYAIQLPVRPIFEESVSKVMSNLLQCREEWLIEKLVSRIHITMDADVQSRVMRMHGYQIFSTLLSGWNDQETILVMILEVLTRWPRLTKNKISSSQIESTVQELADKSSFEQVKDLARELLEEWSSLEMAYRIPRREKTSQDTPASQTDKEKDQEEIVSDGKADKRDKDTRWDKLDRTKMNRTDRSDSETSTPNGQRSASGGPDGRSKPPRTSQTNIRLPVGWDSSMAPNGRIYYFHREKGITTWERPVSQRIERSTPPVLEEAKEILEKAKEKLDLQKIIEEASQQQNQKLQEIQALVNAAQEGSKSGSNEKRASKRKKEKKDTVDKTKKSEKNMEKILTNTVCLKKFTLESLDRSNCSLRNTFLTWWLDMNKI
jgi:SET domain-containing protein